MPGRPAFSARLLWGHALALAAAAPGPAAAAWRYELAPGQRLLYERRGTVAMLSRPESARVVHERIELWCLERQNERLQILLLVDDPAGSRPGWPAGLLLELEPYGGVTLNPPARRRAADFEAALELLPSLPGPVQTEPVWRTPPDALARVRVCTTTGPDPQRSGHQRIEYRVAYPAEAGEALGLARRGQYWFDPVAGLLTRLETLYESRAADVRSESTAILLRLDTMPPAWIRARAEEGWRHTAALVNEDRLLDGVLQRPGEVETALADLRRLWTTRVQAADPRAQSPFERLARARLAALPAEENALRADAAYAARWLHRPAASWSLPDAAGRTHASEEFRGTALVECLWSIHTPGFPGPLSALHALQTQNPALRVRLLNLDREPELPRRAIERLPSARDTILAGPLTVTDAPPRLPVLRVLDAQGVIRRIWLGGPPPDAELLAEVRRWAPAP